MMEYFVGLDVSLRSCALCIVDGRGVVLFERELLCDVNEIADCLSGFPHPIERIGFEAGAMSQHLFFGLTGEGFDSLMAERLAVFLNGVERLNSSHERCVMKHH
jgi:transposase